MQEHLSAQMCMLLAPMHDGEMHDDTTECVFPASAGSMTVVMQRASACSDFRDATGTDACLRIAY